jgi:preprotein translocase subunit YajC
MFLISPAHAQGIFGGGSGGGFDLIQLAPLVLIFVVFYFLIIRPQQKKVKDHKAMVDALRRGDRVVTSGGIIGTVVKVMNEREVSLDISDGVRVRVMRGMISEVMARTEPAGEGKKEDKPKSEPAYYKTLGISENASAAEISAAYSAKAGDAAATEAYETLNDPTKRKLYDKLGHDEYVSLAKG